jgi:hypothetical protein
MPSSAKEGKLFFKEWLGTFTEVKTILDVGPGSGIYSTLARMTRPDIFIDCVEIYEPYVERFGLHLKYRTIIVGSILDVEIEDYDLIILGDVLEHLTWRNAIWCWKKMKAHAKFVWLSLPLDPAFRLWFRGYNQPKSEWAENVSEKHCYTWQYHEVIDGLGPFLWQIPYKTVGVFIAEGDL